MTGFGLFLASVLLFGAAASEAQAIPTASPTADADLKYVVYISRHGVRSPTGKPAQYNLYSAANWPEWDVPPGNLTAHGYRLMEIFGAYDRLQLAGEGLLAETGCDDASRVTFYADSDQRTRETGRALAAGLLPGCNVPVQSLPEGVNDPLFHPNTSDLGTEYPAFAAAAIAGRIGSDPANLTAAYRSQLGVLDRILGTCGVATPDRVRRVSLFEIPSSLAPAKGDRLADLRGPVNTASTLSENLLLEYTQGMPAEAVGWGCVAGENLRSLIDLHTAATDYTLRTPAIARALAANLLGEALRGLEQAALKKYVPGAKGRAADKALFLIGHDTNLTTIAGALGLNWIVDGRRDDTPPGGALVFELWKNRKSGVFSVRTYFTVQTLEQMHLALELTPAHPPQRVPVFVPGCGEADISCSWPSFRRTIQNAIAPTSAEK